jgi:hypothetical protein
MTPSTMPVAAQMMLGAGVAIGTYVVMIALLYLGVPLTFAAWVVLFFVIWIATFIALKKQMMSFLVSYILTGGSIYLILAARGFRL